MGREKNSAKRNVLIEAVSEIFRFRELLINLALRDIKVVYKQTFLGITWAIFPSVITMLIFTFINNAKIITIDTGEIPYPLFAYCGLLPWTFFVQALSGATTSIVNKANLINKIYFPREIIPLSLILSRLVNLGVSAIVMVGLMVFYGVDIHITIIAVPLLLLIQIALTVGLSFFLSMGHVFYRDVGYIVVGILPLLMFITSVVYPIKVASRQLQGILIVLNPMIPIIDSYRDLILLGRWPDLMSLALPICLCWGLFFMGLLCFHKMEHLFAENI